MRVQGTFPGSVVVCRGTCTLLYINVIYTYLYESTQNTRLLLQLTIYRCYPKQFVSRISLNTQLIEKVVRFEVFTAVTMKNAVFWDVELYRYCISRRFGGTCRLYLQGRRKEKSTSEEPERASEPYLTSVVLNYILSVNWYGGLHNQTSNVFQSISFTA
jgi:hypothetical protein